MANTLPPAAQIAQFVGITTALYQSGATMAMSTFAMPSIQLSPASLLTTQWRLLYKRGRAAAPPLAVATLANLSYVAYHHFHAAQDRWIYFAAAAALCVTMVPYTFLAMLGTNDKLMAAAEEVDRLGKTTMADEEARKLVETWSGLNLVRSGFGLVGGAVALWAAMK